MCNPVRPPALASLTPPVNGDFPPIEIRSVEESMCPTNRPGAKMSLFPAPNGSHLASTSSNRMRANSPRPPRRFHVSGIVSSFKLWSRTLTRQTCDLYSDIYNSIMSLRGQFLPEAISLSNKDCFPRARDAMVNQIKTLPLPEIPSYEYPRLPAWFQARSTPYYGKASIRCRG